MDTRTWVLYCAAMMAWGVAVLLAAYAIAVWVGEHWPLWKPARGRHRMPLLSPQRRPVRRVRAAFLAIRTRA